ncbi:DUF1460 domain-containing protein [Geothermobacter hydrogeniphilus]|uniref:DUF1460 domain-containing protein n=1 Tax=Geothermobacter hydrogeniphilus TaxID=1969733 RepID=A0A2K2H772_9BACT|nr:N-acetylmuramoyl-L-alanine amidase-like domain-containing protein [Geothermobacter hydrogeniphilus]PNU19148.1 DUF1460 domain-containing protein [Geothermobacter hydrogeniphilus]
MILFKILKPTFLIFFLMITLAPAADRVNLGRWSDAELARIITAGHRLESPGEQIVALSSHFLATPYVANSLVGGPRTAERLVINLAGFDCFTFLDTVEALRRASGPADFPVQLRQVRYRVGKVAYKNRRHFFSDWVAGADTEIVDVTATVGQGRSRVVTKQLNLKDDGGRWLPGISVRRREIVYIPTSGIDGNVLSALRAGDYVGIYSDKAGLDVSHTGLLVKEGERFLLRHASSRDGVRRVVDVDLPAYLQGKPGLVVYRAR